MEMDDKTAAEESDSLLPIDEHEEIVSRGGRKVIRRGVYLLPNLLTLGALFAGFYAIIAGMSGNFNQAGWAILIAGVLDGLDGRIARLTRSQSAFGAEFDSLADMVSFGMAPALIMFSWAFEPLGRLGWAASFFYMACAAFRLARFNVQLGTVDKRFFLGLQSPAAAGLITFIPWVGHKYGVEVTSLIAYPAAAIMVLAGLLMISNYRYFSFKVLNVKGTVPYMVLLLTLALLVVVAQYPKELLLAISVVYAASAPAAWFYRKRGAITDRFRRGGGKPAAKPAKPEAVADTLRPNGAKQAGVEPKDTTEAEATDSAEVGADTETDLSKQANKASPAPSTNNPSSTAD